MFDFSYSYYFGILTSFNIFTISAWLFTSAFLLILTGVITSIAEIISLRRDNLLFTILLASSLMLLYLGLLGLVGALILPFIWLSTHILIIQARKG